MLGYTVTNNPHTKADVVVNFSDTTIQEKDPVLYELCAKYPVINARCQDISKERVEKVFEEVFGYAMSIDPSVHTGLCVKKSDTNGVHNGCVVTCPVEREEGNVYEKLINNQCDTDRVTDIRVLVFGDTIPFIIARYRSIHDRFDHTQDIEILSVEARLSQNEVRDVLRFCNVFGLDYGELDVLRDRDDGRIYIVDVNNTPSGMYPRKCIGALRYKDYMCGIAQVFSTVFLGEDQTKEITECNFDNHTLSHITKEVSKI
jgi:hypothetical protein